MIHFNVKSITVVSYNVSFLTFYNILLSYNIGFQRSMIAHVSYNSEKSMLYDTHVTDTMLYDTLLYSTLYDTYHITLVLNIKS